MGRVALAYRSHSYGYNFSRKTKLSLLLLSILWLSFSYKYSFPKVIDTDTTPECWLTQAFEKGDFILYSHRSFVSSAESQQPTCKEALSKLHDIGVNHIDLDLVLSYNNENPTIYVSHPMEFKKESSYYSPCSMTPLKELITLLDAEYGKNNWFTSLEPKASWGRTEKEMNDVALVEPVQIMTELLKILEEHNLTSKKQCAVIIDVETVQGSEESKKLEELLSYCQLFVGKRKTDKVEDSLHKKGFRYDKVMPTIEFHPEHQGHVGLTVPSSINKDSLYWVIDDAKDLYLAAKLKPNGIVSNEPEEIVSIIKKSAWCNL